MCYFLFSLPWYDWLETLQIRPEDARPQGSLLTLHEKAILLLQLFRLLECDPFLSVGQFSTLGELNLVNMTYNSSG